jgi:hypothetical protein
MDDALGAMLIDAFDGGEHGHRIVEREEGFIAVGGKPPPLRLEATSGTCRGCPLKS